MKKLFGVCVMTVMLVGGMVFNAAAIPISGTIEFSGLVSPDQIPFNDATSLDFAPNSNSSTSPIVLGGTGDYSLVTFATPVAFTDFNFATFAGVSPLWTFNFGGNTYSFEATNLNSVASTVTTLRLEGTGTASITGRDNTPGTWVITANAYNILGSFSSSTAVPEPASILLVGFGLVGLAGVGRKLKK